MISPATIQIAIIALLKADAALVAGLGATARIKEAEWRGTSFAYPALRVDMTSISPQGNGACAEQWLTVEGALIVYSKEDSSLECLTLLGVVQDAIQRQRLSAAGMTGLELKIAQLSPPDREENIWRGAVLFTTTAIET